MVPAPPALQALALILVAVAATAVVLTRDPVRQLVVTGVYGLLLTILFVILQAPDVALSMLAVSTALLYLAASYRAWHRLAREAVLDSIEGIGVGGYTIVGLAALLLGLS